MISAACTSLNHSRQDALTIFLTAYGEYALTALEIHALDNLLKPIDEETFFSALNHAPELLTLKDIATHQQRTSGLLATDAEQRDGQPMKTLVVRERGRRSLLLLTKLSGSKQSAIMLVSM